MRLTEFPLPPKTLPFFRGGQLEKKREKNTRGIESESGEGILRKMTRNKEVAMPDRELYDKVLAVETQLNRVIRAGYDLLGLQTYFTAGPKEVRAWTIHKGDTAPQAAGVIHSDFERGFIRAQTISYDDYISHNGEKGAQEAGRMRAEGKDYVVADGDVMNFLFNV